MERAGEGPKTLSSRKPIYALLAIGLVAILTLTFVPYTLTRLSEAGQQVISAVSPVAVPVAEVPPPPPPPPLFDAAAWFMSREEEPEKHGVLIESLDGRRVLASHNADTAFNPASLIKLATSLAALRRLGPDYRFETRVYTTGTLDEAGTLRGRIHVAGGDPSFGDSAASLIGRELRARGVKDATEGVTVSPDFSLNFNPSPEDSAKRLVEMMQFGKAKAVAGKKSKEADKAKKDERNARRALKGRQKRAEEGAEPGQTGTQPPGAGQDSRAAQKQGGADSGALEESPLISPQPPVERPLFVLRSNSLREILLYMNAHSNNFVAERIGAAVGGPAAVQSLLAEELKLPASQFTLSTTSGLDYNRMTPRAVVGVVRALHEEARRRGLRLEDLMPVVSSDRGTLRHRLGDTPLKGAAVGKTGTLARDDGGMASLAGVVYTQNGDLILFALLDRGHAVWENRQLEEQLLAEVVTASNELPAPLPSATPRQLLPPSELIIESADGAGR